MKTINNDKFSSNIIFKMATNKETHSPKKERIKKNDPFLTKEQEITKYLKTQVKKSIVTPEYVEKYAEIQGKTIREINKLFHSGKYRFGLAQGVLILVKVEHVLSYRQFYVIETRYLKMRDKVQTELARIYESDGEPFVDVVLGDICAIHKDNVWYRGEVIRVFLNADPDKTRYSVRLIDFGRVVRTHERRIRLLKGWLVQLSALVVACTLTDLNEDEVDILTDQPSVVTLFNQLEKIASNAEKILIHLVSTKEHSEFGYLNEVYLFAVCQTESNVSNAAYLTHEAFGAFNPMKIEFREPLCTEWLQKGFEHVPPRSGSQFGQKYAVKIRYAESPTYFYVQMTYQTEVLQKIRKKMEIYVSGYDPNTVDRKIKWKIGDDCLCLDNHVWYRGQIKMLFSYGRCHIYLRDTGRTTTVPRKCMLRMPIELSKHPDCVRKCHLDISTVWLNENADDFRKILRTYKWFAVSTNTDYDYDKDSKLSVGVSLFGTISEPYLENDQVWENIGTRIISKSIMIQLEYFITKTQYYYRRKKYQSDSDTDSERSFDHILLIQKSIAMKSCETLYITPMQPQARITIWMPTVPLVGTTFMASIAHISDEGVFFLHSDTDLHLVCQINQTIDAIVETLKQQNDNSEIGQWEVDMACYAKSEQNEFPEEYYRATIKSIDWAEEDCIVEFIDYGNYGGSKLCDLHVAKNFGDVPSLAHPYYLKNVIASSESGKWNPAVLGPCRQLLVDTIFSVFVEHENDNLKPVVPCEMQFLENNMNLFDWLISKQLNNGTQLDDDDEDVLIVKV